MRRIWGKELGAAALAAAWIAAAPSLAAKLDKPECDGLKTEREQLLSTGLKADMDHGPEWAKAHLAPERLLQVKRLMEIEEQLNFRCDAPRAAIAAKLAGETPGGAKGRAKRGAETAGTEPAPEDTESAGAIIGGHLQPPDAAPKRKAKARAARQAKPRPNTAKAE